MPNAYTDTAQLVAAIAASLDRELRFELRAKPIWRQFLDVKPQNVTNPGSPARLKVHDVIAEQTAVLDEIIDPDSVVVPAPRNVDITPVEQGMHTIETLKLRELAYLDVVKLQARAVSLNMIDSIDKLVMRAHDAGTKSSSLEAGVYTTSPTEANIAVTDVFTSSLLGRTTARLRERLVEGRRGDIYAAVVHPFVSLDIQSEGPTTASWVYAHANGGDVQPIYNGMIGTFRGADVVESRKVRVTATGAASAKVFTSYFLGREFAAQYVVDEPRLTMGLVGADAFNRKIDLGWYGLLGFATYRDVALERVKTSSSLQASATANT